MAQPKKIPEKQVSIRDEKHRFVKGHSGNPLGKPPGTLDFKTKWLNFVEKVAAANDTTIDEIDEQLLAVAFKQAKNANYQFYKDIQDRVHGKAAENLDVMSGGKPIDGFTKIIINTPDGRKNAGDKSNT